MTKHIETGVFIPVGKNGWIHSINAPDTPGTFNHVLQVTQNAEALGFDFVLSPAIWRGRKGPSRHWMVSLESITTTSALLYATKRINIWSTAHMTVFPPAVIAKMVATLDQIGPGRVGLNLVTGSSVLDLDHVGLWNDALDHDERYRLGDEWIQLVKRFWTEDVVSHKGEFFSAKAGAVGPKPSRMPRTLNAGSSDRGLRFAVENCDAAFLIGSDEPLHISNGKRAKEIAKQHNKPHFKTYGLFTLIPGETEAEAQAMMAHFDDGVDEVALADVIAGYELNKSKAKPQELVKGYGKDNAKLSSVGDGAMVGSHVSLARRLAYAVLESELDGIMLIVPDFIKDLGAVATRVLPKMAEYGVTCGIGSLDPAS